VGNHLQVVDDGGLGKSNRSATLVAGTLSLRVAAVGQAVLDCHVFPQRGPSNCCRLALVQFDEQPPSGWTLTLRPCSLVVHCARSGHLMHSSAGKWTISLGRNGTRISLGHRIVPASQSSWKAVFGDRSPDHTGQALQEMVSSEGRSRTSWLLREARSMCSSVSVTAW
jgi:hypothetical protein